MAFSNQCIKPVKANKPHIVKLQGLWRVSPLNWKKIGVCYGHRWDKAHALTNSLNDKIRAEHEASRERQREWKLSQLDELI